MTKYVIFESYDGFYKIVELETEVRYKRYGDIRVSRDLLHNVWYDLDYKLCKTQGSGANAENIALQTIEETSEDTDNKRYKTEQENKQENKQTNTANRNKKTIDKIAQKKKKRKTKCFRIRQIDPCMLHKLYSLKCHKQINYITNACLALLQFYVTSNTLVFDKIKGLLVYSLLYKVDAITIHRKNKQCCFDVLKYLENKKVQYIQDEDGNSKTTNDAAVFDTVVVAGEYDNFLQNYKKHIGNIVLFYIRYKEEAVKLFYELLVDTDFVDVSIFDFFTREWQIYDNVRPQMNCDLRCGWIVRAVKVKQN